MTSKTDVETSTDLVTQAVQATRYRRNVKDRVATLKAHETVPHFKSLLQYAYNPYYKYGVSVTPGVKANLRTCVVHTNVHPLTLDDSEVWDTLDYLRTSTDASSTKISHLQGLFTRVDSKLCEIILAVLEKSLISGVAASTVNKAFPGLIPSFSVQLAAKYSDRKVRKTPVYAEPKYDGMRAIAIAHVTGEVEFLTRTGRPILAAKLFEADVRKLAVAYRKLYGAESVLFDGEVLGETFNDTVSVFRKGEVAKSGTFQVFDVVPLKCLYDSGIRSLAYEQRRAILAKVFDGFEGDCHMSPSYLANSKAEIWNLYERSRELGFEGLIIKNPEGLWQGKRSNDWLKIKAQETLDLPIIGAFEGKGELEGTLGGLIVNFNGVQVRVGSGIERKDRDLLFEQFLIDVEEERSGGSDFLLLGNSAEVQYQEVTPDGSLRHPVFVRLRRDKDEVLF